MSWKDEAKEHAARRVERVRKACGGETEMKRIAEDATHKHERVDHPGSKLTHAFEGKGAAKRLDRKARAHGGRTKSKPTEINIVIDAAPQRGAGAPMPPPVAAAPPPAPMPPPRPPMAPPMGAMPPGAVPRPPIGAMPMRKRGGKVVDMDAGAGSGLGRLEKIAEYGSRA